MSVFREPASRRDDERPIHDYERTLRGARLRGKNLAQAFLCLSLFVPACYFIVAAASPQMILAGVGLYAATVVVGTRRWRDG